MQMRRRVAAIEDGVKRDARTVRRQARRLVSACGWIPGRDKPAVRVDRAIARDAWQELAARPRGLRGRHAGHAIRSAGRGGVDPPRRVEPRSPKKNMEAKSAAPRCVCVRHARAWRCSTAGWTCFAHWTARESSARVGPRVASRPASRTAPEGVSTSGQGSGIALCTELGLPGGRFLVLSNRFRQFAFRCRARGSSGWRSNVGQ